MVLKLFPQSNLPMSDSGKLNLRMVDSAPNFGLARRHVSEGFFANLWFVLTHRPEKISGHATTAFHARHFRSSFTENLKELFRPAPKIKRGTTSSLSGIASRPIKTESHPLALSLLVNIRDAILPSRLPPLELTSEPVDVPEIWSKRKKLTGSRVVSVIVHACLVAAVVVLAARQVTTPDPVKTVTVLIAPPAPSAAPPPPAAAAPPRVVHPVAPKRRSFFVQGKLTAPTTIPKVVVPQRSANNDVAAPDLAASGAAGDSPGGVLGGVIGGSPGGIPGGIPGPPGGVSAPAAPPATTPRIVRVGGDVKQPRAIYTPAPETSRLARQAGARGIVVLDAIIDEHGNVTKLHAVTGPPLLIPSALKAVAQWKFEPTYLDGVPVSIEMEVRVTFH